MNHTAHATLFEIKSDPDHANDDAEGITAAITEFKSAVDDRLVALETKSADDRKRDDRLKALELRLSRTGSAVEMKSADNDNGEIEQKAFKTYLRGGKEGMGADEIKSLTVSSSASAGYLAPPTFGAEMLKYLVQFSPVRTYAAKMQISGTEVILPRRLTTVSASWVLENDTRTDTTSTFEPITLKSYELARYIDISNQLLEDNSYNLEAEIVGQFGEMFGKIEGAAFVNGTGTNQPMGVLTSPQIASITSGGAAGAGTIGLHEIIALYHNIPSAWAQNAVWMMNRATIASLRGILDSVGRPLVFDSINPTAPMTIFGRPIIEAIDMPNATTGLTPIVFGDFGGFRIIDRVGLTMLRDPYSQAAVGMTRFHARKRVGADVTDGQRFIKLAVA